MGAGVQGCRGARLRMHAFRWSVVEDCCLKFNRTIGHGEDTLALPPPLTQPHPYPHPYPDPYPYPSPYPDP